MQFDINADWHTLISYTRHHGLAPTQVGPSNQPSTRYLSPDDRDFFAVYRQLPGPVTVPPQIELGEAASGSLRTVAFHAKQR